MVFAVNVPTFADEGDAITATTGTITVQNAAKGETYKIYKIFDATISKVEGSDGTADAVAYYWTGTKANFPTTLGAAFELLDEVTVGSGEWYVKVKDNVADSAVITAVQNYMKTLSDSDMAVKPAKVAQGGPVVYDNLPFGYYGITSSQGAAVTIDSANPNATIYDKNSHQPEVHKEVEKEKYSIGDTVKYTATFKTPNFLGDYPNAKQVTKIKVLDTVRSTSSPTERSFC